MVDETKLAISIDEYIEAVISADEKWIEKSIKNLHGLETAIEPELIQPFLDAAKCNSPYVREAAIKGLGEFGDTSAIPSLLNFLKDVNSRVRQAAVHSIGKIGYQPAADSLVTMLNDVNPFVREEAIDVLGGLISSQAVDPLIKSLDDENIYVQLAAINTLGLIEDSRAIQPLLLKLKSSSTKEMKIALIHAIGDIGEKAFIEPLYEAIENIEIPVEQAVSEASREINKNNFADQLIEAVRSEKKSIKDEVLKALEKIGYDMEDIAHKLFDKETSETTKSLLLKKINNVDHGDYITSDSGVPIWKSVQVHPHLCKTITDHPDFLRKAGEVFPKGLARGLPRICSKNSEDARLWVSFSPLLENTELKQSTLSQLMEQAFPEKIDPNIINNLGNAQLKFWHGRSTPELILEPPSFLPHREGKTEVDLVISVGNEMIVFLEAKFHSDLSPLVKNCPDRDQAIRMIDVGSWYAREQFSSILFIFLQFGDYPTNTKSIVNKYKYNPEALTKGLQHRIDLTEDRVKLLSQSISYVSWVDPFEGPFPNNSSNY